MYTVNHLSVKCLSAAVYCPAIPRTLPVPQVRSFLSKYITGIGTVVGWVLRNVVGLHIAECNTVI